MILPLSTKEKNADIRQDRAWQYWRSSESDIVEVGTVHGLNVALPIHFHEEDQITFVLSGRRRFIVGNRLVDVPPGQGLRIPARTPHRSLSDLTKVVCVNVYVSPGRYETYDLISSLTHFERRELHTYSSGLHTFAKESWLVSDAVADRITDETLTVTPWETVSQAAQVAGMSREGFSRRFKKRYGIPPHTSLLLAQLNTARKFLRAGESIALVAAETGFSDQSHLGRWFRRAFGVTPGQYRLG